MFVGYSVSELEKLIKDSYPDFVYGEEIKPHTVKKIEFVTEYVDQWLYVVAQYSRQVFFVDAMCNSGIYKNHHLSTFVEVINVFARHAQAMPNTTFYLMCNDNDIQKIKSLEKIVSVYKKTFMEYGINNLIFCISRADAKDYISQLKNNSLLAYKSNIFKTILLYVDPYDLINKDLATEIQKFSQKVYCEVLINFDTNDLARNRNNLSCPNKMAEINCLISDFCLCSLDSSINKVVKSFINRFKPILGYHYLVRVKNSLKAELYRLIFLTRNLKGLEKIKEATWKSFSYHDEYSISNVDNAEPDIFGMNDEDWAFRVAVEKLEERIKALGKDKVTFIELEEIILQNSFLKKSHIIDKFLKPLINKGVIVKQNLVNSRNYTEDCYVIYENNN